MFRYLWVMLCLVVVMVAVCFDAPIAETKDVDLAQQIQELEWEVRERIPTPPLWQTLRDGDLKGDNNDRPVDGRNY